MQKIELCDNASPHQRVCIRDGKLEKKGASIELLKGLNYIFMLDVGREMCVKNNVHKMIIIFVYLFDGFV